MRARPQRPFWRTGGTTLQPRMHTNSEPHPISNNPKTNPQQAHPRRVAKVASQVQRELSDMLLCDDVVRRAVDPSGAGGGALTALASITSVYVSNDLQVVKAYVSIYSDQRGKQTAMTNLKRLEP